MIRNIQEKKRRLQKKRSRRKRSNKIDGLGKETSQLIQIVCSRTKRRTKEV
jgi:hypothetical protein